MTYALVENLKLPLRQNADGKETTLGDKLALAERAILQLIEVVNSERTPANKLLVYHLRPFDKSWSKCMFRVLLNSQLITPVLIQITDHVTNEIGKESSHTIEIIQESADGETANLGRYAEGDLPRTLLQPRAARPPTGAPCRRSSTPRRGSCSRARRASPWRTRRRRCTRTRGSRSRRRSRRRPGRRFSLTSSTCRARR